MSKKTKEKLELLNKLGEGIISLCKQIDESDNKSHEEKIGSMACTYLGGIFALSITMNTELLVIREELEKLNGKINFYPGSLIN